VLFVSTSSIVHVASITDHLISGLCYYENKRRDRLYGKPVDNEVATGLEVELEDLTDVENKNFRYSY